MLEWAKRIFFYSVLLFFIFLSLGPFVFSIATSFKAPPQALTPNLIPSPFTLDNYLKITREAPLFFRWIFNSIYIAIITVFFQVFFAAMAAYAFARLKFPGRRPLFLFMLVTMMIPGQVMWIPSFIILNKLGWINTHWALIVPGLVSAGGIFLMAQFFKSLPVELEEAAIIDGYSKWGIFWKIILPLSKPVLASYAVISFMGSWNNFTWPVIVLQSPETFTLPIGLKFFQGMHYTMWTYIMAGSMFNTIPVLIIFMFLQRFIIKGMSTSGLKG